MKKDWINIGCILGFEKCKDYLIFLDGRIYSLKTSKFMRGSKNDKGYLYLDLRKYDVDVKLPKFHRLVMMAFSNEEIEEHVNHKDGNKENNDFSNLEWVTNEENRTHAILSGLKDEIPYGIVQCDLEGNELNYFRTCEDALKYLGVDNGSSGNIGRVIRGKRNTAYGYRWKTWKDYSMGGII